MGPAIVAVAAALLLGGVALTRKSPSGEPGKFVGRLHKGQLYRIWVRVPIFYSEEVRRSAGADGQKALLADIRGKVEGYGFKGTMLVTQDPTDNSVFTLVSRWGETDSELYDEDPARVFMLEEVEEPPVLTTAPAAVVPPSLDEGLTAGEIEAVKAALATNSDMKHLAGFATTLEPYFPLAASLLRAKAAMIGARSTSPSSAGETEEKRKGVEARFVQATDSVGWFGDEALAWSKAKSDPAPILVNGTRDLGIEVAEAWNLARGKGEAAPWLPISRVIAAEDALAIAKMFREPSATVAGVPREDVGEVGQEFGRLLATKHPALSLVPAPGSGVLAMYVAASALALSQPLASLKLEELVPLIPEGQRDMFKLGWAAGTKSVIEGPQATQPLLHERENCLGEKQRVAFDLALCLARAKALQVSGFRTLYLGTRGAGPAARAGDFATCVKKARESKRSVSSVLADKRRADLETLAQSTGRGLIDIQADVRKAVTEIVKDAKLLRHGAIENSMGFEPAVAAAARSVIREIGDGIRVVDAEALKRLLPSSGREHIVSPTALQLALASTKPLGSGVLAPEKLAPIIKNVQAQAKADPQAERAQEELVRAKKTLERTRWVEWYRKQKERPASSSGGTLKLTGREVTG